MPGTVFVTGGTGYLGRPLIARLLEREYRVIALVRAASRSRLPAGCEVVVGDALDARTFASAVPQGSTFVQLVGTPHPSPSRAAEFRRVDLVSARESVRAAVDAGVRHFVYVSVAQPAPVMQSYIAVRREAEQMIVTAGLAATILRPWYVLGPGHRWPVLLLPLYALARRAPTLRPGAERLHPVTLQQMTAALVNAVASVRTGVTVWGVPELRAQVSLGRMNLSR
jgi:uncharacterized protein YbjT (DUF2867 family)